VLDSSALLAVLFREPGAETVSHRLTEALMSAVNLSEVTARMVERGVALEKAVEILTHQPLVVMPFDADQAYVAASLRSTTRKLGLSLGDRACLALALRHGVPVLTADQLWAKADVGVTVEVIR
jgi:PIN domain nuclease of toxin-antitoxin system